MQRRGLYQRKGGNRGDKGSPGSADHFVAAFHGADCGFHDGA